MVRSEKDEMNRNQIESALICLICLVIVSMMFHSILVITLGRETAEYVIKLWIWMIVTGITVIGLYFLRYFFLMAEFNLKQRLGYNPTIRNVTPIDEPEPLMLMDYAETEPVPELLPLLSESEQVWLVGGQGSGKTTVLAWLLDAYLEQGEVIVIDSHNEPGKYPADAEVIGSGKDYFAIYNKLTQIIDLIDTRIKELATGETRQYEFETVRVLVDEYTMVPAEIAKLCKKEKLENIMDTFRDTLCTEGRKVRVLFCFATHSERAEVVGFKRRMDLFLAINHKVRLRNINGNMYADVQYGAEKELHKFNLPGVHLRIEALKEPAKKTSKMGVNRVTGQDLTYRRGLSQTPDFIDKTHFDAGMTCPDASRDSRLDSDVPDDVKMAVELREQGVSWNKIIKQKTGKLPGGRQIIDLQKRIERYNAGGNK